MQALILNGCIQRNSLQLILHLWTPTQRTYSDHRVAIRTITEVYLDIHISLLWHSHIRYIQRSEFKGPFLEVLCGKDFLKIFSKLIGKHLHRSLFLRKLQALACKFIQKEILTWVFFPMNFAKSVWAVFYRTPTSEWFYEFNIRGSNRT